MPNYNQPSGICTAALIFGIVGLFINPFYVCVLMAIIFGIIGLSQKPAPTNRNHALIGLILGASAGIIQVIVDLILSMFGFVFSWCI